MFRNDPSMVARLFAEALQGEWGRRFDRLVFAVFDTTPGGATLAAFERELAPLTRRFVERQEVVP